MTTITFLPLAIASLIPASQPQQQGTNRTVNPPPGNVFVPAPANGQVPVPPNPTTSFRGNATSASRIQTRLRSIIQQLNLRLHSSDRYFIKNDANENTTERYYPQLNGTVYVEGETHTTNGRTDPVRPRSWSLDGQDNLVSINSFDRPYYYTRLISAMGLVLASDPSSTPPNNRIIFNDNWTFTSPAYPGVTFRLQHDGSIWGSNGITYSFTPYSNPYSNPYLSNPYLNPYASENLRRQPNTQPLPATRFFTQHSICPLRINYNNPTQCLYAGAFRRPGQIESFLLQADGSIFYTGRRQQDGSWSQPLTYEFNPSNNTWTANNSRRNSLPLTYEIARLNLNIQRLPNNTYVIPGNTPTLFDQNSIGDVFAYTQDNRCIRLAPSAQDMRVYEFKNGQWVVIQNRNGNNHQDTQVQEALRRILASRTDRNWIARSTGHLNNVNATQYPDGTFAYRGADTASHGDSIYVMRDGRLLMLNANSNFYYIHDGRWSDATNRNTIPNLPQAVRDDINAGIQAILASRTARNYRRPNLTALNLSNYGDGTLRYDGSESPYSDRIQGDSAYVMPNGDVVVIDPGTQRIFRHNGTTWTSTGHLASSNDLSQDLKEAVNAIQASRQRRGWTSPQVLLESVRARSLGNGNWEYHQPGDQWRSAHGDTVRVLSNGSLIGLNRNSGDLTVYIYGPDREWRVIGTRTADGRGFTPSANFNNPQLLQEIPTHAQAILQSRRDRNWRPQVITPTQSSPYRPPYWYGGGMQL